MVKTKGEDMARGYAKAKKIPFQTRKPRRSQGITFGHKEQSIKDWEAIRRDSWLSRNGNT